MSRSTASTILVLLILVGGAAAGDDHARFGFSVGYGRMPISDFIYDPALAQDPSEDGSEDWSVFVLTPGLSFNGGRSEITLDFMFTGPKRTRELGTRPLVGGGRTRVSRSFVHVGLFLGFRERVVPRFYVSGGIGFVDQGVDYQYSPPVVNGAGGFSETYGAWFWGLDFRIYRRVLGGFKLYQTQGSEEKALRGGKDTQIETLTFHLTLL